MSGSARATTGDNHTPKRNVRVADDLWSSAKEHAARQGETVTDVIVTALRKYAATSAIAYTELVRLATDIIDQAPASRRTTRDRRDPDRRTHDDLTIRVTWGQRLELRTGQPDVYSIEHRDLLAVCTPGSDIELGVALDNVHTVDELVAVLAPALRQVRAVRDKHRAARAVRAAQRDEVLNRIRDTVAASTSSTALVGSVREAVADARHRFGTDGDTLPGLVTIDDLAAAAEMTREQVKTAW